MRKIEAAEPHDVPAAFAIAEGGEDAVPRAAADPLWRSADWPNASLYCVFQHGVLANRTKWSIPRKQLSDKTADQSLVLTYFWLSQDKDNDETQHLLSAVTGESAEALNHRSGEDLATPGCISTTLDWHLRYCPTCLRSGYHSTLFQHFAFYRCPEHGDVLRTGCARCERPFRATVATSFRDPFACPRCGFAFARPLSAQHSPDHLAKLDRKLSAIRRGMVGDYRTYSYFDTAKEVRTANMSNQARRFMAWPMRNDDCFASRRLHEVIAMLSDEQRLGAWDAYKNYGQKATDDTLGWIASKTRRDAEEFSALAARLSGTDSGLRLEGRAPTVVAALCQTALICGRIEWLKRTYGPSHSGADNGESRWPSGDRGWPSKNVDLRLVRLQVLSMYAFLLAKTRGYRRLDEVPWHEKPDAYSFMPAAVRLEVAGFYYVRIRPRSNERTVERLIRRMRDRYLQRPENPAAER